MAAITLHTADAKVAEALAKATDLQAGRTRDEFQVKVDGDVRTLKADTAKAGWPEPGLEATPFHYYVVGKDDKAELNGVIRRAGTLHKVEIDFFKPVTTEAGHVIVKFNVSRKLDKDDKPVKDESLNDDGSPKDELAKHATPEKKTTVTPSKPGAK